MSETIEKLTIFEDTRLEPAILLPAINVEQELLPVARATEARKLLKESLQQVIEEQEQQVLNEVEETLEANPIVLQALAVFDTFENSGFAPIYVFNLNNKTPVETVSEIVELTGNEMNQVVLCGDLNPVVNENNPDAEPFRPTVPLGEAITEFAKRGISVNLVGQLKEESYEQIMRWIDKYPLLSSNPGTDAIAVVAGKVYHAEFDPNASLAHSPLGAILGKQIFNDLHYGIGEPLAGLRPDGNGGKGVLKNLAIAPQPGKTTSYNYKERLNLVKRGVNTLYTYNNVPCIVGSNRSLEEGNGIYIFRNTTRLRQVVASTFHKCVEIEVLHAGKREAGPLEKAADEMNKYLRSLKSAGWLESGVVKVDLASMLVRIKVQFAPNPPIYGVEIVFSEDDFFEDQA